MYLNYYKPDEITTMSAAITHNRCSLFTKGEEICKQWLLRYTRAYAWTYRDLDGYAKDKSES